MGSHMATPSVQCVFFFILVSQLSFCFMFVFPADGTEQKKSASVCKYAPQFAA